MPISQFFGTAATERLNSQRDQQHSVDVARLWKRLPQSPQEPFGGPWTGPIVSTGGPNGGGNGQTSESQSTGGGSTSTLEEGGPQPPIETQTTAGGAAAFSVARSPRAVLLTGSGAEWLGANQVRNLDGTPGNVLCAGPNPAASQWLVVSDFDFGAVLPVAMLIDRIEVECWCRTDNTAAVWTMEMRLLRSMDDWLPATRSNAGAWSGDWTRKADGGSVSDWGGGLTRSEVCANSFGVAIRVSSGGVMAIAGVDAVRCRVFWTVP